MTSLFLEALGWVLFGYWLKGDSRVRLRALRCVSWLVVDWNQLSPNGQKHVLVFEVSEELRETEHLKSNNSMYMYLV